MVDLYRKRDDIQLGLAGGSAVHPIFASGLDHQAGTVLDLQMESVQAGRKRSRAETQQIIVGHIVRYRDEARLQILLPVKVKEFASGELRDRFRGIGP